MQSHQRYFPLGGRRVAIVANAGDPEIVRGGHIHVLESRLADASFTFERDVAVGIEGLVARLGSIVFVRGGGTFADKSARLWTRRHPRRRRRLPGGGAARESRPGGRARARVPELEGYIGGEYARLAGFPEGVCARDRAAVPAGRIGRPAAVDRAGQDAGGGGQARHAHCGVCAGPEAERLTRSLRTPSGGDRALPACARGRAPARDRSALRGRPQAPGRAGRRRRAATTTRSRSPISSPSGSRTCSTCRSSSCARRGARRSPSSAASPGLLSRWRRLTPRSSWRCIRRTPARRAWPRTRRAPSIPTCWSSLPRRRSRGPSSGSRPRSRRASKAATSRARSP